MPEESDILPPRKILVVATVGGSTNTAPIFEVCKLLHERGHTIEFATLAEREKYAKSYPFISNIHVVGRAITAAEEDVLYLRFCEWSWTGKGLRDLFWGKKFFEAFWPETYINLKKVVESTQPDMIFGDYLADAARDMQREYNLPLAVMYPQWPYFMCPAPYIAGTPGLRMDFLTNEKASMWARIYQETYILQNIMPFIDIFMWTRKMRAKLGLGMLPILRKPDHLVLVNSFIGIETPKDVPPLLTPVGPILSDHYTPLDDSLTEFLVHHDKTVLVAFGTHVILSPDRLQAILFGLVSSLEAGHINGVIWAMREGSKVRFLNASPKDRVIYTDLNETKISFSHADLLENRHPNMRFVDFAPQRAVLDHPSTRVFFTHAGPSSVNECVYHGVPMLTMGMFGDQLARALALDNAGVAQSVRKETVTADQIVEKLGRIMNDVDGLFHRNVLRLKRTAIVNSRRKTLAADLVEEFLYDHELRFAISRHDDVGSGASGRRAGTGFDRGEELRHMHLETADMRMNPIRARNIDLWLTGALLVPMFAAAAVLLVRVTFGS